MIWIHTEVFGSVSKRRTERLLLFAPRRRARGGALRACLFGVGASLRRHGRVALVDPLLEQLDRHVFSGLEMRAHPTGLSQPIPGGLRPREHRNGRFARLRQLAGEPVPGVGVTEEDEDFLRHLVDGLAPGMILPRTGLCGRVLPQSLPRHRRFHSRSSSQAIWIASRIFSFDLLGSSSKPGSSRTHLCRSVKRTESGSVSGNFSCSAMPISWTSCQVSFWAMSDRHFGGHVPAASASWRSLGCSSYHVFSDSSVIW